MVTEVRRPAIRITSQDFDCSQSALNFEAAEATQSHFKATPKPPQSLLITNRWRSQSHPKTTSKPPQGHAKATPRPPSNQLIWSFQDQGGAETTSFSRASGRMRNAAVGPLVADLTRLGHGRLARYGRGEAGVCANARLCSNEQAFRWAVSQSEVLARLRERDLLLPASVITFGCQPAAVAAFQVCIPGARGWRLNPCRGGPFTSCTVVSSLLEAVVAAARNATSGDVVLPAPAYSSRIQFQNHQNRDEVFCLAAKSIGRGVQRDTPNINGKTVQISGEAPNMKSLLRGCFEATHRGEADKLNQRLKTQTQ
jgi:hypothetical protein